MDPFEGIIDEELEPRDILTFRRFLTKVTPGELAELLCRVPRAERPRDDQRLCRLRPAARAGSYRYSDPDVPAREHPADIVPEELDKLRGMMLDLINEPEHFRQWFGEFISQSRHELDVAPPEPPYQADEIYDALQQGDKLVRLGGLRVLRIGEEVFVNGEKLDSPHRPALEAIASHMVLTAETFGDALEDPSFLAMLAALVNSGYWFLRTELNARWRCATGLTASRLTRLCAQSPSPPFPSLPASQTHACRGSYSPGKQVRAR